MEMEWSNRQGSRDRRAWCLVVGPGDQIEAFTGASIPGKAVVVGKSYTKEGKWSHTTYRLELGPGVRLLTRHDGWETGTFREAIGADRWEACANALGVSVPVAQEFLRAWRPKAAAHYDRVEAELSALDEIADDGATEVVVSFGAPTRKRREAGFWEAPVVVTNEHGHQVGRVESGNDWNQPVASGPVRVLDCKRSSGHGGGYVSLRLAVPESCSAKHQG